MRKALSLFFTTLYPTTLTLTWHLLYSISCLSHPHIRGPWRALTRSFVSWDAHRALDSWQAEWKEGGCSDVGSRIATLSQMIFEESCDHLACFTFSLVMQNLPWLCTACIRKYHKARDLLWQSCFLWLPEDRCLVWTASFLEIGETICSTSLWVFAVS